MEPILRKTISEIFLSRSQQTPTRIGFQFKPTHSEMGPVGQWKELTFKEFYQECRLISFGLMGVGIQPQEKVVILSNTRIEWSLCDMAILGCKAVTVPIYASNTPEDVAYITVHSESKLMFLEDAKQLEKVLQHEVEKPGTFAKVSRFVVLEPSAVKVAAKFGEAGKKVISLQALRELGREEGKNPNRFDENLKSAQPQDLITICYTSGTTGVPKGVLLNHDNMISVMEDCVELLGPVYFS